MDARTLLSVLTPERARFVSFARGRVASAADAEDVVQRAMMRAADRASSLEDPRRARAWFHRILRNAIADHHRTRAGDPARAPSSADPADLAADQADEPVRTPCACAMRLLEELRPSYAEVLRRVDLGGEDPSAVAAAIGISPSNLHVRIHRTRRSPRTRPRALRRHVASSMPRLYVRREAPLLPRLRFCSCRRTVARLAVRAPPPSLIRRRQSGTSRRCPRR